MKKNYSRILYVFVLIAFIASLVVVYVMNYDKKEVDYDKIQIVTTVFPYYSLSNEICNFNANVVMLIKPGSESHTYEPTSEDIKSIINSDIFIYTGGESDKWVETILSSIDTNKTKIIKTTDYVEPLKTNHHGETSFDEHIWTSMKNAKIISQTICNAICEIDIQNKHNYTANTQKLINKLEALDSRFTEIINNSNKTVVFADRFPFAYFAREYNLNYISAFESCTEESEPSVQAISNIINTINEQDIGVIFYIEFSNQKVADMIVEETGVKKLLFHSCHNISQEEFNEGASFISIMENNLNNLEEAIN